jgi:outer membrane protein assembly factor BamB
VLVGGLLFLLGEGGVMRCLEAVTGNEVWQERIGGEYYASLLYGDGNIYAADYGGGRVQVFDAAGEFVTDWTVEGDSIYLTGMAVARDGTLYLVYGSELYHVDGQTGEELEHIEWDEGWGFEDVVVLPDGGLAATWYKTRDDLVIFDADGQVVAEVHEAISSITGSSAVTMKITVDNAATCWC